MKQLGSEGNFVGSGIFKSENPEKMARAIVKATTHFRDAGILAEVSRGTGNAMKGLEIAAIPESEILAKRGW
jgi:pyridoxal 5'-phosphate synthase pdxS subunit